MQDEKSAVASIYTLAYSIAFSHWPLVAISYFSGANIQYFTIIYIIFVEFLIQNELF